MIAYIVRIIHRELLSLRLAITLSEMAHSTHESAQKGRRHL